MNKDVLEYQYKDDPSRWVVSVFKEKGVSVDELESWKDVVKILYPWDEEYNTERLGYNRYYQFFPLAIILCKKMSDIRWSLSKVIDLGIKFSLKNGGHCHVGSFMSEGFMISMSSRNYVLFNEANRRIKIGSGTQLGQVIRALKDTNYVVPMGTCMNVAACGLAVGLGVGLYIRKFGASIDNVLEFKLLTADNRLIKCNDKTNSDLFWAMRGAGAGNFGIVTDIKLKVHKVDYVFQYRIYFDYRDFERIISIWQKIAPYASNNLCSKMSIIPLSNNYSDNHIIIHGHWLDDKNGEQLILEVLNPLINICKEYEIWESSVTKSAIFNNEACSMPPWFFSYQTLFANELLNKKCVEALNRFLYEAPQESSMVINALGGEFGKYRYNDTAFPWRDSILWIHIESETRDIRKYEIYSSYTKSLYDTLIFNGLNQPHSKIGMLYANFKDLSLKPDEWMNAYYGQNANKLREVKKKYDPNRVFNPLQGVV